ncbi:hypothetical protein QWM81_02720 [Streptomyces ficellus]|uniref:Cytochrome C oxidase subunit I n=1 Tax=Streptomyces ficellus TaxID=1977088 RepID=A0ABT7Z0F7_9ACTN|nr:hypothetical protein [Streptomyces ficellus]MDN3292979.1 hypothetical protein [Streptomyces ficellus]
MAVGINSIEGYLLYQSELSKARAEGEAFAERMPWLTTAQYEEVARLYAQARLEVSTQMVRAIAARCAELRQEYTVRYEALRQRLLCLCVAALVCAATLLVAAITLTTGGP